MTQTRVLILSDTHGFVDPRILALARNCDTVVHAGDIGNAAVLTALAAAGAELIAVRGNNDTVQAWPRSDRAVLKALPLEQVLELPHGRLVIVHGDRFLPASRRHERLRRHYPQVRVIIYGHSHALVCDRACDPWVLNPGAAGRSRTFGGPSCLILRTHTPRWEVKVVRFHSAAPAGRVNRCTS